MTGPEHYREAERLLAVCAGDQRGSDLDKACTAAAQVHATLAVAAAAALNGANNKGTVMEDWTEWRQAAGQQTAGEQERERIQ